MMFTAAALPKPMLTERTLRNVHSISESLIEIPCFISTMGLNIWKCINGLIYQYLNVSPHESQWRGDLMFSLISAWINGWVNNREAGDLRRNCTHHGVTVFFASNDFEHVPDDKTTYVKMADIITAPRIMMTSSNEHIFRVTGHLCGEFTGHRWIPRTKASEAEI